MAIKTLTILMYGYPAILMLGVLYVPLALEMGWWVRG